MLARLPRWTGRQVTCSRARARCLSGAGATPRDGFLQSRDAYERTVRTSLAEETRGEFWLDVAKSQIDWFDEPEAALALAEGDERFPRWFPGGRLNTCHNALDRHVLAGRGARTAIACATP